MTAQKGSLVLLKVGDGGEPESFTTIGGLRATRLTCSNQLLESTHHDSGPWRQLLSGAGIRSLAISGSGMFTDSAAEETVRLIALSGQVRNWRVTFGNGDLISGPFQIASYQRGGDFDREENYALSLASAGEIEFAAAP